MIDKKLAPVCGIFCGDCSFYKKDCQGCGYVEGRPFWTSDIPSGICPLHDCCRNSKNLEHCGLCEELPCRIFLELRDPDLSDEEFQASLTNRENELKRRADIGTEEWLKEKSLK
jgi:hypothetical protein